MKDYVSQLITFWKLFWNSLDIRWRSRLSSGRWRRRKKLLLSILPSFDRWASVRHKFLSSQLLWVVWKCFANFSRTQVDTTNETGPQLGPVKIKIWSLILNRKLSRFRDVFWKVMNALRWWNISKAMRCAEIMLHICWMIPFWYQICSFYLERENFWNWYLTTRWQNKQRRNSAFGGVLLPLGHCYKPKKPSRPILSRYPLYL